MLKYTGHPLVDVGVATITAFAGKRDPTQLTETDLDQVADYITREYTRQPLRSFLTVAFPNSGFTQPAYNRQPEKRLVYAQRVLRAYSRCRAIGAHQFESLLRFSEQRTGVPTRAKDGPHRPSAVRLRDRA